MMLSVLSPYCKTLYNKEYLNDERNGKIMKKRTSIIIAIVIVLFTTCSYADHEKGIFDKETAMFYFIPEFALATNYTSKEWTSSEETCALLDLTLMMDYASSWEDEPQFSFDLNQLAYVGRDGDVLSLTVCSEDMKDILLIFFDVSEKYCWSCVIHGRDATPRETIESSTKKSSPDGFYRIDNTILNDLSAEFLKTVAN